MKIFQWFENSFYLFSDITCWPKWHCIDWLQYLSQVHTDWFVCLDHILFQLVLEKVQFPIRSNLSYELTSIICNLQYLVKSKNNWLHKKNIKLARAYVSNGLCWRRTFYSWYGCMNILYHPWMRIHKNEIKNCSAIKFAQIWKNIWLVLKWKTRKMMKVDCITDLREWRSSGSDVQCVLNCTCVSNTWLLNFFNHHFYLLQ